MVYTYSGVSGSLKEGNPAIWSNVDEPGAHEAKWNKPVTEGQILHNSAYTR